MSASEAELTSMDNHAVEKKKRCRLNDPLSVPLTSVPSPSSPFPHTRETVIANETVIESKAVSMASNGCGSALSSPAEGSPAKAAVICPSALEGTLETSPATSHTEPASNQSNCTGTSLINFSESQQWASALPSTSFGSAGVENDFPSVLTFKGISVTLENNSVWKQFYSCGTEMILTKQGRRMFPYCRYRLSGLDPEQKYNLVLSIVPTGQYRYRWSTTKWEVMGPVEHQTQGLIRAYPHHYSPCKGSEWMSCLVSFYKLKLTNNLQDRNGHIILHSMHRYIPRLHIIPVPDGGGPTCDQPVVMGPESLIFTFPQTEFMAVTTYQNFCITQLKISHNPFAKGFREDGNNPRLNRVPTEGRCTSEVQAESQPTAGGVTEACEQKEEVAHLSSKSLRDLAPNTQDTRPVLKPIMSNPTGTGESYVPCIRGKHALGKLVLVQKRPRVEPREANDTCMTPEEQLGSQARKLLAARSGTPSSSVSTPRLTPQYRKRKRRMKKRYWGNSRGKLWKSAAAASPTVVHSPSLTVAMQPELDEVEGLLFVSFTSKEALEVHVRDKPGSSPLSARPVCLTTPIQSEPIVEANPETAEEKMARLESVLLSDLRVLKHRQIIHPVLQEVGLKLSSLDPTVPIDLHYLGVILPPPNPPEQNKTVHSDESVPFISRTGKTSDMTKIKGWKNKFIKSKESSTKCEGLQKNLSAFCSNMLDEYLESEAQQISERAAAFCTNPEGSVAYQLPAKSSSYVKTLDSILRHQNTASKLTAGTTRPCPRSHKPPLSSDTLSPATSQEETQSRCKPTSPQKLHPDAANDCSQRPSHRLPGFNKVQLKLLHTEMEALNRGLSRTHLTPERITMALSALVSKEMLPGQISKAAPAAVNEVEGPECEKAFCWLGCVCPSLQQPRREPLHCRRPECMFGCACFKRQTAGEMNAGGGGSEDQSCTVYSMKNMGHTGCGKKLWTSNSCDVDLEPLYIPKASKSMGKVNLSLTAQKSQKQAMPSPAQMQEDEKDPVYLYFESKLTCARVREFNSKPPPEVTLDTNTSALIYSSNNTTPRKAAPNQHHKLTTGQKAAEKSSKKVEINEAEARKQIQIQSMCPWRKDRQMVLKGLCERMKQNRLHQHSYIGPYCIIPVAKVAMRKPSGSLVTYRIQITRPSKVSDEEEESDEEKHASKSSDENSDSAEEDEEVEDPDRLFGVTPFLCGVAPAGRLRARRKHAGRQASGLIQVNGKYYNHARLLLGSMGSLHPANRLAAYVTGRLHGQSSTLHKLMRKQDPTLQRDASGSSCGKAADTLVPPKTADPWTVTQPSAHPVQPGLLGSGSLSSTEHSLKAMAEALVPVRNGSAIQSSSRSSPIRLTVSPSLKSPSFLAQSGTCSFRICPPSSQAEGSEKPQGVALPGGFTLIQLPQAGAHSSDSQHPKPQKVTKAAEKGRASNLRQLASEWFGGDSLSKVKILLSSKTDEPGQSFGLICEEKNKPLGENRANNWQEVKQEETSLDVTSEDMSSDFSDDGEGGEDGDMVDIETVEETEQEMAISKLKEAALKTQQETLSPGYDVGPCMELKVKTEGSKIRSNHTELERRRRSEQRMLFDQLRQILDSDPKTPKFLLLHQAVKEIQNLEKTSESLEEEKKQLMEKQAASVKQLSLLAGKPEDQILSKLKAINEQQKMLQRTMTWTPVFSQLLQTKAVLLQATAPSLDLNPPSLPQPDHGQLSEAQTSTAAQKNLQNLFSLFHSSKSQRSLPDKHPAASCPPQAVATVTPSQAELPLNKPAASFQISCPASNQEKTEPGCPDRLSIKATFERAAPQMAQKGALPSSNRSGHRVLSPKPLASLPLVRSKTGRIILPSSLKPLNQGFYTLVVMNPREKEKSAVSSSADTKASDADSPKCSEENVASANQPSESEPGRALEHSAAPSDPKLAGVFSPLRQLALLNKSIVVPSPDLRVEEKNEGAGKGETESNAQPSAPLSSDSVRWAVRPEALQSRRSRKWPFANPPAGTAEPRPHVSETPSPTEGALGDKIPETDTKMWAGAAPGAATIPAPVKARRGRPPKRRSLLPQSPPAKRAATSPSDSFSPGRLTACPGGENATADAGWSRPLTRGSLGKDFPSAKKRSWIDIEGQLEPDPDSE